MPDGADELLAELCHDLRVLRYQAGGPSLRELARQVRLGKTQVGAILAGRVRTPPDWRVVRGLVESCYRQANEQGRGHRLSLRAGIEEYWRPRYAVIEHAFSHRPPASRPTPASKRHVPRQLPGATRLFAGRRRQLAELEQALAGVDEFSVIAAVSGTAGVGKTALAVHWAYQIAERFPDGQLYVNLRGFDASGSPAAPVEALRGFLDALGVPAEHIPSTIDSQVGLYRSLLAGRRILVVLDNARDAEQVRPLLPTAPGSCAVVTSRHRLNSLTAIEGAHPITLEVLSPAEANELLARRVGARRLAGEPDAVAEILDRCARLPLALAILAARAASQPTFPLSVYAAELREAATALDALASDDPDTDVRAVFSWSCQALSTETARLFRLLGLHPGPDLSVLAAASLAGIAVRQARIRLTELALAHLVTEHTPGRYIVHDLLRAYAYDETNTGEYEDAAAREAAAGRLDAHYLDATDAAARLLYPTTLRLPFVAAPSSEPSLADHRSASTWLEAEYGNLVAQVVAAGEAGRHATAYSLGDMLAGYFWLRRYTADWLLVARAALAAAVADGDLRAQAASHRHMSGALHCSGRINAAAAELDRALAQARRASWREGQAAILNSRANAALDFGDTERAEADFMEALALFRAIGHTAGEPVVLSNLGSLYGRIGRLAEAANAFRQSLVVDQRLGATSDIATDLSNLGGACWRLGCLDEALQHLTAGLDLHREVGNRAGEANTLNYLARVHHDAGRDTLAASLAEADLSAAQQLADPVIETDAWNAVAATYWRLGRHEQATDARQRALGAAATTGYAYGTAEALIGFAASTAETHQYIASLDYARQALDATQKARFRIMEGHARAALAAAHLGIGDVDDALGEATRAEAIYRGTGHRLGQARALRLLGATVANRHPAEAQARWRAALALLTEVGSPEAEEIRQLLLHG